MDEGEGVKSMIIPHFSRIASSISVVAMANLQSVRTCVLIIARLGSIVERLN
jgi:hypothetical protein